MTSPAGERLRSEAERFAHEITALLAGTVVTDPPIDVTMIRDRAVVGSVNAQGDFAPMTIGVNSVPAIRLERVLEVLLGLVR